MSQLGERDSNVLRQDCSVWTSDWCRVRGRRSSRRQAGSYGECSCSNVHTQQRRRGSARGAARRRSPASAKSTVPSDLNRAPDSYVGQTARKPCGRAAINRRKASANHLAFSLLAPRSPTRRVRLRRSHPLPLDRQSDRQPPVRRRSSGPERVPSHPRDCRPAPGTGSISASVQLMCSTISAGHGTSKATDTAIESSHACSRLALHLRAIK